MVIAINKYLNFKTLINFLFALIPISFIAGNLLINLNIFFIIVLTLSHFGKEFFKIKFILVDKFIILFFLFCLTVGFLNFFLSPDQENIYVKENLFKSIAFLRYLLFYFALRIVAEKKIFDFKIFFASCSLSVIFVSLDLIFQLMVGVDFFGNVKDPFKLSGPFGDELIAGSYLQRFSIFLFFFIPSYLNLKNQNILIIILTVVFIVIFFSILIAGNRMPMILFLLMFLLLFIYEHKLRKFTFLFILVSSVFFVLIFFLSAQIQDYSQYFIRMTWQILIFLYEIIIQSKDPNITNSYIKEFYYGYVTWKENLIIGGGINSFYLNCSKTFSNCASHPHNYYLEILSDLGILGLAIISIIFTKLILMTGFKNSLSMNFNDILLYPFALLLFAEIFPLKTSGSFFTTGNATFIFLIIALVASLAKKHSN